MVLIGILFALLSALSYALSNSLQKSIKIKKIKNLDLTFLFFLIATLFTFLIFIVFGEKNFEALSIKIVLLFLVLGVIGFLPIYFIYKSFDHLKVGVIFSLANSFPIFVFFFNIIFFDKEFNLLFFVILLFFFFAACNILDLKIKKSELLNIYLVYPFITALSWAGFFMFLEYFVNSGVSPFDLVFFSEFSIFLVATIFLVITKRVKKINYEIFKMKQYYLIGLFAALGTLFSLFALLRVGSTLFSIMLLLIIPLTAVFSYFMYGEKLNKKQIFGIVLMLITLFILIILKS